MSPLRATCHSGPTSGLLGAGVAVAGSVVAVAVGGILVGDAGAGVDVTTTVISTGGDGDTPGKLQAPSMTAHSPIRKVRQVDDWQKDIFGIVIRYLGKELTTYYTIKYY
jgi:hypothetical protein